MEQSTMPQPSVSEADATKKLHIITYGCQMNVYDSEQMGHLLTHHGYQLTEDKSEADLIILNTCHIREKATEKAFSDLGRLSAIKTKRRRQGKTTLLAVAGCTAQAEGEEIARRAPYVDMIFGPQAYHDLPEMIATLHRHQEDHRRAGFSDNLTHAPRAIATNFETIEKFDALQAPYDHQGTTAFVTIQEGCDKFCHFCVVPYTRGAEMSRPARAIIEEIQRLVDQGVIEVTLLGQNVNAYHGEALDRRVSGPGGGTPGVPVSSSSVWSLGRLCYEIAHRVPELKRLRYTTCHPKDVHDEQIMAHGDLPVVMPLLHLPVQSGSDTILKAMNRKHTRAWYLEVIDRFRDANPHMAFTSDFIVGYPGETDQDFLDTLSLVQEVDFAQSFSFIYSPRPGTPASLLKDTVSPAVARERLGMLQQLLQAQQHKFNLDLVGKTQLVLFDKIDQRSSAPTPAADGTKWYVGRSPYLQSVRVPSATDLVGQLLPVKISSCGPNSLRGCIIPSNTKSEN